MFDRDVWASMPGLLDELFREQLIRLACIESLPDRETMMLGGISFIHPEYVDQARVEGSTLPNTVFRAVVEHRMPFLSPKEVGNTNARCELHLMNFFGNIKDIDLNGSDLANFYEVSGQGYHFLDFGNAYRALWVEVFTANHVRELQNQGMQIERQLKLSTGQTSTLMCLTREFARANPYLRRAVIFSLLSPISNSDRVSKRSWNSPCWTCRMMRLQQRCMSQWTPSRKDGGLSTRKWIQSIRVL